MSSYLDGVQTALLGASIEPDPAEAALGSELVGEPDPNDFEQLARRVDELAELVAAIEEGIGEAQLALEEAESALAAAQADLDEAREDGRDE
jgi:hypothetical protein